MLCDMRCCTTSSVHLLAGQPGVRLALLYDSAVACQLLLNTLSTASLTAFDTYLRPSYLVCMLRTCLLCCVLQVSVWQCTHPDGLDVFFYPTGQVEGHFPEGRKEVIFADGAARIVAEDG